MKINKFILSGLMILLCLFFQVKGVYAYEFPQTSYYVQLDESSLGQIKVYFPSNQVQFLSLQEDGTTIINVSSGTVYGYFDYQGSEYRITFPAFDVGYYRLSSSYNNTDLNVLSILDTNIEFLNDESIVFQNESFFNRITLFTSIGGFMILCLILFKR